MEREKIDRVVLEEYERLVDWVTEEMEKEVEEGAEWAEGITGEYEARAQIIMNLCEITGKLFGTNLSFILNQVVAVGLHKGGTLTAEEMVKEEIESLVNFVYDCNNMKVDIRVDSS